MARQLSPHFSLEELTRSGEATRRGISNQPDATALANLTALATKVLEPIRALVGRMDITSGYRSPELNAAVDGASESQHMKGEAADFKAYYVGSPEVMQLIWDHKEIPIDQVILYDPSRGGHVHVSYSRSRSPRRQFLFAPAGSTGYVDWSPGGLTGQGASIAQSVEAAVAEAVAQATASVQSFLPGLTSGSQQNAKLAAELAAKNLAQGHSLDTVKSVPLWAWAGLAAGVLGVAWYMSTKR